MLKPGRVLRWSLPFVLALGCSPKARAAPPSTPGDAVLGAVPDATHRDAYQRLTNAVRSDAASAEVDDAARALLEQAPPADLASRALLAMADRAWLSGEDGAAIDNADDGLEIANEPTVRAALSRVLVRALVRGGDPARALEVWKRVAASLPEPERLALHALALDRDARVSEALVAMLRWRAAGEPDDASATYAVERAQVLAGALSPVTLKRLAGAEPPAVAACLRGFAGAEVATGWAAACARAPVRIGMLLPRTGKYAALADVQLAAASAALEVLGGAPLVWRDTQSTTDGARAGAVALAGEGVDVVVGPLASASVDAVAHGSGVPLVLPAEGRGETPGVAPTIEARVAALVKAARGDVAVLVPDNGYGRRASRAASKSLETQGRNAPKIHEYPADTTSFAKLVAKLAPELKKGSAVLVADRIGRLELIVRQLRRAGFEPGRGDGQTLVLSTGEGDLPAKRDVLEGVRLAPVALAGPGDALFVSAYVRREGVDPPGHALLVFRAVQAAMAGGHAQPAVAQVVAVQGGSLVPDAPPTP